MTPKEFEDLLVRTRLELTDSFKHGEVAEQETYVKAILDYQELIARYLFNEFHSTQERMTKYRGDILKDNREKFETIMAKLDKK